MEPNKFEKQIKDKLNAREISPSASSWDRLDAMLSVAEKEKPKRSFRWLFIAAGIVGFVFVGLFFMNQKDTAPEINNNQTVVESNVEVNAIKEKEVGKRSLQAERMQAIQNKTGNKNTEVAAIATSKTNAIKNKKEQEQIMPASKPEVIKQTAIAEAVPQKAEEKGNESSNSTTLLAVSESNASDKINHGKPKLKINANALLSQVDGEIELTFRQKTIKTISKKFESAREAIVSRNQE